LGEWPIARGISQQPGKAALLSLVFAAGERPCARDVEQILDSQPEAARGVRISHRPEDEQGWLELLSSGLTFDLTGLMPALACAMPPALQYLGLPDKTGTRNMEAIALAPSPHIAAGGAMIPVARVMLALAAQLTQMFPPLAVCWHPSGCWMEAKYFERIVESWLFGGAFPALGLASLQSDQLGDIRSHGLDFFLGQEVVLEAHADESTADLVKRAVRLIDQLVRLGAIASPRELVLPDGEVVFVEPSANGRLLRLWQAR
jgi:hypothetical protein